MKKWVLPGVLIIYAVLMLLTVRWGIPNQNHPYNYQMDEWHSLMAVKSAFRNGTTAVSGSSHGTMFYFLLTGIYLVPFWLLGVVDPFAIKSGLTQLDMLGRLFIILRLNTLIFGLLSIIVLTKILKEHFKTDSLFPILLFIFTPVWLCLSNYFKYDIALVFWISAFIYYIFKFINEPSLKNYLISGIFCAFAVGTKISALPLVPMYIFSFFCSSEKKQKSWSVLVKGLLVFGMTFLATGIPDIFVSYKGYFDVLFVNLSSVPSTTSNILLGMNSWIYLLLDQFPANYGYFFLLVFLISFAYCFVVVAHSVNKGMSPESKKLLIILFGFFVFVLSLIPLKIFATANRSLVLLPFMVVIIGVFLEKMKIRLGRLGRLGMWGIIGVGIIMQMAQSLSYYSVKLFSDPRELSSVWMKENLSKGTLIGIENVPIYQMLPDLVVKEFYPPQNDYNINKNTETNFKYELLDISNKTLPTTIILTNESIANQYLVKSPKREISLRLKEEKYKLIKKFVPEKKYYHFFGNDLSFYVSNLVPVASVNIYRKR